MTHREEWKLSGKGFIVTNREGLKVIPQCGRQNDNNLNSMNEIEELNQQIT